MFQIQVEGDLALQGGVGFVRAVWIRNDLRPEVCGHYCFEATGSSKGMRAQALAFMEAELALTKTEAKFEVGTLVKDLYDLVARLEAEKKLLQHQLDIEKQKKGRG